MCLGTKKRQPRKAETLSPHGITRNGYSRLPLILWSARRGLMVPLQIGDCRFRGSAGKVKRELANGKGEV
jgi:hypothetical protein